MSDDKTPPAHGPRYKLRLFITGSTPRSTAAIQNMRRICAESLQGDYDLEVIDVYQHPDATRDYQIVATPTRSMGTRTDQTLGAKTLNRPTYIQVFSAPA